VRNRARNRERGGARSDKIAIERVRHSSSVRFKGRADTRRGTASRTEFRRSTGATGAGWGRPAAVLFRRTGVRPGARGPPLTQVLDWRWVSSSRRPIALAAAMSDLAARRPTAQDAGWSRSVADYSHRDSWGQALRRSSRWSSHCSCSAHAARCGLRPSSSPTCMITNAWLGEAAAYAATAPDRHTRDPRKGRAETNSQASAVRAPSRRRRPASTPPGGRRSLARRVGRRGRREPVARSRSLQENLRS